MKRRTFIQCLSGGAFWASALPLQSLSLPMLRFGIVTDLHYAQRDVAINRYYRQSKQKLQAAIDQFGGCDFVVELGDFKDMDEKHDPESALRFLDEIESVLQSFRGRVYHVLGNHDMDCISKEEFLQHTRNAGRARGKSYYSFGCKGMKFIVLDANFNEDGTPYCRGNFDWTSAFIPQEEIEWLRRELKSDRKPVIIFCHQMLDYFSGAPQSVCVANAQEVVHLLEQSGRVRAVIQGHHHSGHYSQREGICYWTMKAMIESAYPEHNSYAIVTVNRMTGQIFIDGFADCEDQTLNFEPY